MEKSNDIRKGTPLGVNNDPLNVFSVNIAGELVASGEIYGGLTTKREYSNYHLRLQYKWGDKKWEPRLEKLRDAGLLYHCTGVHGAFWNVWMRCLELQIQENDTGDLYALAGGNAMVNAVKIDGAKPVLQYNKDGESIGVGSRYGRARIAQKGLAEEPHGEWNTVDLYCIGSDAVHMVNGKVVNVIRDAHIFIDGIRKELRGGKIQLQSEGATIYYNEVQIKALQEFPADIKEMMPK